MLKYRPNAAAIVTDGRGRVLVCQRLGDAENIQTVQGGIDAGETVEQAAVRELYEEIGIAPNQFEMRAVLLSRHRYDWSPELQKKSGFAGQEQSFVLIQVAPEVEFDLSIHHRELERVWWDTPEAMVAKAWPPKRSGLRAALIGFGLLSE